MWSCIVCFTFWDVFFFFFKQKTAYELRISDWSSDVCSSDLRKVVQQSAQQLDEARALYRDLNKMTDIGNVANQLKNDVLRTSNVSSSSLDGYTSGDLNVVGGLRGKANDVYQDLLGRGSPT